MKTKHDFSILNALDEMALIIFTDEKGQITRLNEMACQISGYEKDELIEQNFSFLKSDTHSDEFIIKIWKSLATGDSWRGSFCYKKKNGEAFWCDTNFFPLKTDEKVVGYGIIGYDISKLIHTQTALFRTSQLSDIINSSIEEGIILQDAQDKILYFNQQSCNILGSTQSELLGQKTFTFDWSMHNAEGEPVTPEQLPNVLAKKTKQRQPPFVIHIHKPDGKKLWLNINSIPIKDDQLLGGIGTVTTIRDITEKCENE